MGSRGCSEFMLREQLTGEGSQPGLPGFPEVVGAGGFSGSEKHRKVWGRLGRVPKPPAPLSPSGSRSAELGLRSPKPLCPLYPREKESQEPQGSVGDGQDTRATARWPPCVWAGLGRSQQGVKRREGWPLTWTLKDSRICHEGRETPRGVRPARRPATPYPPGPQTFRLSHLTDKQMLERIEPWPPSMGRLADFLELVSFEHRRIPALPGVLGEISRELELEVPTDSATCPLNGFGHKSEGHTLTS
ncbi:uncharacterized protein LOC109256365 [Panthera pardus]|uniref:Uncharacterized protein LOC109256365 n=1 Tax=Panthera pardus TaxID=9691 RepID=A0A9W2W3H4_PANPR|nr:uncharacterized protein LOC109256365 [Panthera pardus]